ncbi:hypothetical protein [Photobacterium sp. TY1-4]|uniref:hypothetical protein n=1 Tax=Photobacterium sp. TY1-4 TaxID=2899122 RepID=UPI0021C0C227|nr:hypothetical protein [Photobacterium sp. TY1-4]UXI03762.1 hypothetical protein NH461_16685 [Photobacterium sp. TY1-4]
MKPRLLKKGLMNIGRWSILSISLLCAGMSQAESLDVMIEQYNQVALGQADNIDDVHTQFEQLITEQGASPIALIYLGSTQTLKAGETWLPWKAMRLVEEGVAKIEKGLSLQAASLVPLTQQRVLSGIPESFLAQAIAASTLTSLPEMFHQFEPGFELYLSLLALPEFEQAPYEATAWIYHRAVEAAIRAGDRVQANQWLAVMRAHNSEHPLTQQTQALIEQQQAQALIEQQQEAA